jgi:hypothetical protein
VCGELVFVSPGPFGPATTIVESTCGGRGCPSDASLAWVGNLASGVRGLRETGWRCGSLLARRNALVYAGMMGGDNDDPATGPALIRKAASPDTAPRPGVGFPESRRQSAATGQYVEAQERKNGRTNGRCVSFERRSLWRRTGVPRDRKWWSDSVLGATSGKSRGTTAHPICPLTPSSPHHFGTYPSHQAGARERDRPPAARRPGGRRRKKRCITCLRAGWIDRLLQRPLSHSARGRPAADDAAIS